MNKKIISLIIGGAVTVVGGSVAITELTTKEVVELKQIDKREILKDVSLEQKKVEVAEVKEEPKEEIEETVVVEEEPMVEETYVEPMAIEPTVETIVEPTPTPQKPIVEPTPTPPQEPIVQEPIVEPTPQEPTIEEPTVDPRIEQLKEKERIYAEKEAYYLECMDVWKGEGNNYYMATCGVMAEYYGNRDWDNLIPFLANLDGTIIDPNADDLTKEAIYIDCFNRHDSISLEKKRLDELDVMYNELLVLGEEIQTLRNELG